MEHAARRRLLIDLGFYTVCAIFAAASALWSEFYGYRVWGNFATPAYLFGVGCTLWLLAGRQVSRWLPVYVISALAIVIPLGVLVVRRLTGVDWLITPVSWAAQPEVWVIERSASLLLHTGSPYVDMSTLGRVPVVNDYTPYGPAMSVFGLPRAIFGGGALTDARLYFALVAAGTVLLALRLLGWPKPTVGAAQLALIGPLTTLTAAVAGPDLAIIGLLILAGALAARGRTATSAAVLAIVVSMKLTALPAVVVLAALVLCTRGGRALGVFIGTHLAVCALLNVPVALANPGAFVENVIKFPMGMGEISSPAASPLPGYLIASTGPVGHVIALILLAAAAVAIMVWLIRRPVRTGSDAMLRVAVGLGTATLLTPATRWGYLVYPLALLGAMLAFSVAETSAAPAAGTSATHASSR